MRLLMKGILEFWMWEVRAPLQALAIQQANGRFSLLGATGSLARATRELSCAGGRPAAVLEQAGRQAGRSKTALGYACVVIARPAQ